MKCIKCGATDVMLHRTAPKGQVPANWTCLPCIKKSEPELGNNIQEDIDENPIYNDLTKICNGKS